MERYLIGIAGPTASGKTTVAHAIADARAATVLRYSGILAELAHERGLTTDKATLQHLSTTLRREKGEDYLTNLMRERVRKTEGDVVIEGNRRMGDMTLLTDLSTDTGRILRLIYVDASPDIRLARLNIRQERAGELPTTHAAFSTLEADECENELPLVRTYIHSHGTVLDTTLLTKEEQVAAALRAAA